VPFLSLQLKVDRTAYVVGETSKATLSATGLRDGVELAPDLVKYHSSDPAVLKIDEKTGAFRAAAPGEVIITASYPPVDSMRGWPGTKLKLTVSQPPAEDRPVAVRILTDQDQPVRFPVGAEFDDFRVEAEYPDGITRLVTRQATLRTPEKTEDVIVTPSAGRLVGVRAGTTAVTAEFEGVKSGEVRAEGPGARDQGPGAKLQVEVTAQLDVDRIAVVPAKMTLLPGETVPMDLVGYKENRSVGIITGLGSATFNSSNPQVARVDGRSVTALDLGRGTITAQLGQLTSEPVPLSVVSSIADALEPNPQSIRIRVGEAVRIGTDLSVSRGGMDVSRQCTVTPAVPGVVQYVPQLDSLLGVAPGASAVAFACGDKLTNVMVEVLPAVGPIDGEVIIEPLRALLAPGQAVDLRVFVLGAMPTQSVGMTPNVGMTPHRIDRTASAVLDSSDPKTLMIVGNRACALRAGTSEVTAKLPGTQSIGRAYLVVGNDELSQLVVEPPQATIATGETLRLRITGSTAHGTYKVFPQPELKLTAAGPDPEAIQILGSGDVRGVRAGQATVVVNWRNRLSQQVAIQVTDDPLADLRIEPARAVIHPGQSLVYQVTARRGHPGRTRLRVLGPDDGVQLFVDNQDVARVIDRLAVRANSPGRTAVVASVGGRQVQAGLEVVAGAPEHIEDVYPPPPADVVGLRFDPDLLRLSPGSHPVPVRVFELLADGRLGREVTAEPELEISDPQPPGVVTLEKGPNGPQLRPVGPGQLRLGAHLGNLTADPLFVVVQDIGRLVPGLARLVVAPDPLSLWSGETGTFGSVTVDPGTGQLPLAIDYKIVPAADQAVVASAGERAVRAVSDGAARVVVTAADPGGIYDGLFTTATVQVISADPLRIEPSTIGLGMGEATPPLAVIAQGQDGLSYQVPATLESMDPAVLAPDPAATQGVPGRFAAKGLGGTQIRASYRGREAFAEVAVSGQRFVHVREIKDSLIGDDQSFDIGLEVLAAKSEGPLEYRVYAPAQPAPENWVAAEPGDGQMRAVLRSPRIPYGPRGATYHLIIEARSPSDGSIQRYPFSFWLKEQVKRADEGQP
jgi:hypothetical protein